MSCFRTQLWLKWNKNTINCIELKYFSKSDHINRITFRHQSNTLHHIRWVSTGLGLWCLMPLSTIETNSHYLFYCHRFNDSRNLYIESIDIPMNLTLDRLFFGSPDLTDDQNNSLFLNVQKFIINSKRFI